MALYNKIYDMIHWKNKNESQTTPLGKSNLSKEDDALDTLDTRVVELSRDKAENSVVNDCINYFDMEYETGMITIKTVAQDVKRIFLHRIIPKLKDVIANADRAEASAEKAVAEAANAATSAKAAEDSENNAKNSEKEAKKAADDVQNTKLEVDKVFDKVKESEQNAKTSETNAKISETNSKQSEVSVKKSEVTINNMIEGFRDILNEGVQFDSLSPLGMIKYADFLQINPYIYPEHYYPLYYMEDSFVTDETFLEGSGNSYPAGTSIYWYSRPAVSITEEEKYWVDGYGDPQLFDTVGNEIEDVAGNTMYDPHDPIVYDSDGEPILTDIIPESGWIVIKSGNMLKFADNLTTNDPMLGLAASQGVVLNTRLTVTETDIQVIKEHAIFDLELDVDDETGDVVVPPNNDLIEMIKNLQNRIVTLETSLAAMSQKKIHRTNVRIYGKEKELIKSYGGLYYFYSDKFISHSSDSVIAFYIYNWGNVGTAVDVWFCLHESTGQLCYCSDVPTSSMTIDPYFDICVIEYY